MRTRNALRLLVAVATIVGLTQVGVAASPSAPATGPAKLVLAQQAEQFPRPGPLNAITDVDGIEVGQFNRTDPPFLTGTTVVFAPKGAVNGVSVPGGWPGTVNTDVLDPTKNPQLSDAVFLSGGSFYGLSAFGGVMRWLEEHGFGLPVGGGVDPLVSGAIVFDLGRGGDFKARPNEEFGYKAIDAHKDGPVEQGNVGAGTATGSSPFKGGIGTASVEYPGGLRVGAIIAVNAGTAVNSKDCSFLARFLELGNEFEGLRTPSKQECEKVFPPPTAGSAATAAADDEGAHPVTAIAVVATNAKLDDAATSQMASRGADGQVIAIDTIHTLGDGDAVFALSTGTWDQPCTARSCLERVYEGATKTIARAVIHALINAESAAGRTSYCDALPSACKHLKRS